MKKNMEKKKWIKPEIIDISVAGGSFPSVNEDAFGPLS